MRKLTLYREKNTVDFLSKSWVYIEDASSPASADDLTILGVKCRLLGEIRNGGQKTFTIGDGEARLYVLNDKSTADFCGEPFLIPEGSDDLFLSGRNEHDVATGNVFRFGEVNTLGTPASPTPEKNRAKKILSAVLTAVVGIVIALAVIYSIFSGSGDKTLTVDELRMTVPGSFDKKKVSGVTACYGSHDVQLFILKENGEKLDGLSLREYGELVLKNNGREGVELKEEEKGMSFTYSNTSGGTTFDYFAYIYKSGNDFWLVQFALKSSDTGEYRDKISAWADSIEFVNN